MIWIKFERGKLSPERANFFCLRIKTSSQHHFIIIIYKTLIIGIRFQIRSNSSLICTHINEMTRRWLPLICKKSTLFRWLVLFIFWVYFKLDSWHNIRNHITIFYVEKLKLVSGKYMHGFLFVWSDVTFTACMHFVQVYMFCFVGNSIWSEFWWNKHHRSSFLTTIGGTISSSIDYECFTGV